MEYRKKLLLALFLFVWKMTYLQLRTQAITESSLTISKNNSMDGGISLAFATIVGFSHAFEADHLLAVSTLVSQSKSTKKLATSGFIWGLGHTSTILMIGLLLIVFQVNSLSAWFEYFEIFVGIMLIALGVYRIFQLKKPTSISHKHAGNKEAYNIGLVHGLAGSGALILLVMTDMTSQVEALTYLLLFGLGSAIGMAVASVSFTYPTIGKERRRKY